MRIDLLGELDLRPLFPETYADYGEKGCCYSADLRDKLQEKANGDQELSSGLERILSLYHPKHGTKCLQQIKCGCEDVRGHCDTCKKSGAYEAAYTPPSGSSGGVISFCKQTKKSDRSELDHPWDVNILVHELQHAAQCGSYKGNCEGGNPTIESCFERMKSEIEANICANRSWGLCSPNYMRMHSPRACVEKVYKALTEDIRNGDNHALCPGCSEIFGSSTNPSFNGDPVGLIMSSKNGITQSFIDSVKCFGAK
jgi:hypothetical protein